MPISAHATPSPPSYLETTRYELDTAELEEMYDKCRDTATLTGSDGEFEVEKLLQRMRGRARVGERAIVKSWCDDLMAQLGALVHDPWGPPYYPNDNRNFNFHHQENLDRILKVVEEVSQGRVSMNGRICERKLILWQPLPQLNPECTPEKLIEEMGLTPPAFARRRELKQKLVEITSLVTTDHDRSDFESRWVKPITDRFWRNEEFLDTPNQWYKLAAILASINELVRTYHGMHRHRMPLEMFYQLYSIERITDQMNKIVTSLSERRRPPPGNFPPVNDLDPRLPQYQPSLGHRHLRLYGFDSRGQRSHEGHSSNMNSRF